MGDYERENRDKARLVELRERQQTRVAELRDRLNNSNQQSELSHQRRTETQDRNFEYRREQQEDKRAFDYARTVVNAEGSQELEQLRHDLREREREPEFEYFRQRAELGYLIRRQERFDQNTVDNLALERRITELRSLNAHDIHRLVLITVLEHIQGEHVHRRSLEELDEVTDSDLIKSEQAHGHKIKEDNNASRLRVSEMFSSRFLDAVFAQVNTKPDGLSRADLDDLVKEWELEGDRLKK